MLKSKVKFPNGTTDDQDQQRDDRKEWEIFKATSRSEQKEDELSMSEQIFTPQDVENPLPGLHFLKEL